MQFKGQLLLPDDPGPGLRVNIDVAEHHLAVEADGGGLGAWPLEVVDVHRLQGDVFALTVAGEPLRFVADDSISFAYSGVPSIESVSRRLRTRSALRSMIDWIWNGTERTESDDTQPAATVDETTTPVVADSVQPPDVGSLERDLDLFDTSRDWVETVPAPIVAEAQQYEPHISNPDPPHAGCPAIRSDGRRCESPILTSSGYCYPHDPRRAFEDRYREALEARSQLKRDATERLNRIYNRLDKAMRQVERGDLDPETAMAMAQLANTMCAILDLDEPPKESR